MKYNLHALERAAPVSPKMRAKLIAYKNHLVDRQAGNAKAIAQIDRILEIK